MKAVTIAASNLRRVLRWRANVFFLFILPMAIILLLGVAFGAETARVGVVSHGSGSLGGELARALEERKELTVVRFADEDELADAVGRGNVNGGLVVPPGYDRELRAGGRATLRWLSPLEVFPDTVRTIAKATPHAWANDAFTELLRHDGTLADVLPQLGVLLACAALLLALASWLLRRTLTA